MVSSPAKPTPPTCSTHYPASIDTRGGSADAPELPRRRPPRHYAEVRQPLQATARLGEKRTSTAVSKRI